MKKSDKKKVFEAYNEIIDWFDEHRSKDLVMEKFYLHLIQNHVPTGSTILDVGCGTGEPLAKFFIEKGYKVTGIDASKKMIERCKQRFPNQQWILADMRTLNIEAKFNVVIAWHSFFHLPDTDQRKTLQLLGSYVKVNGLLIFTSGEQHGEVWSENGGYDLYHASLSTDEYQQILEANNFAVLIHKIKDPACGDATIWVAQKTE